MKRTFERINRPIGIVFTGLVLLSLTFAASAGEKTPGMTLTFGEREVTVGGVVAGHRIIAFGIGIGSFGGSALLTRDVKASTDDDADGNVTFKVSVVPRRSVWVAVDFETGDYSVATPTGETPSALTLPADSWRGNRAHVDVGRGYLEILLVRRRVGAWTLRSSEGGSNDFDGVSNGVSRLSLDKMEKLLGDEKGPPFAIPKDLIVIIDPQTLDTFVSEAH